MTTFRLFKKASKPETITKGDIWFNTTKKRIEVFTDADTSEIYGSNVRDVTLSDNTLTISDINGNTTTINLATANDITTLTTLINSKIDSSDVSEWAKTSSNNTIPIDKIPAAALDRLYIFSTEENALAAEIQVGDTVQITNNDNKMYFCISDKDSDTTFSARFREYTAGKAAEVPWAGITDKPTVFAPATHTHTKNEITGLSEPGNGTITIKQGKNSSSFTVNQSDDKTITLDAPISCKNVLSSSATGDSNVATTNPYLNHVSGTEVTSHTQITGSGGTTVKSDANGNITISSAALEDTDTHYASDIVLAGAISAKQDANTTLEDNKVYLNHIENDVITSSRTITGTNDVYVKSDNGNLVISGKETAHFSWIYGAMIGYDYSTGSHPVVTVDQYNELKSAVEAGKKIVDDYVPEYEIQARIEHGMMTRDSDDAYLEYDEIVCYLSYGWGECFRLNLTLWSDGVFEYDSKQLVAALYDHTHTVRINGELVKIKYADSRISQSSDEYCTNLGTFLSADNIKTINGESIIGTGDIAISSSGGSGATSYAALSNKPAINNVTLSSGNNTLASLGIQASENGKGLSTNDYTTAEKTKLANLTQISVDNKLNGTSVNPVQNKIIYTALNGKQDTLVSGTSIKTINGESILGYGDITISGGSSESSGASIIVDNSLDAASTNPVENGVITTALSNKADKNHNHDDDYYTITQIDTELDKKQNKLVSGTNICTINGMSILGSGDITISGGSSEGSGTSDYTQLTNKPQINGTTLNGGNNTLSYNQLADLPTLPTKTSQLTNDSGYLTSHQDLSDYVTTSDLPDTSSLLDEVELVAGYAAASTSNTSYKVNPYINVLSSTASSDSKTAAGSVQLVGSGSVSVLAQNGVITISGSSSSYTLPTATSTTLGGVKVGTNLSIKNGVLSATDTTYSNATTSTAGLMSASDKEKLDNMTSSPSSLKDIATTSDYETWTFTLKDGSTVTKKPYLY